MIKLIVDYDNCFDEQPDIYCNSADSYLKTRLLIDEVKEGLKDSVTAVISEYYAVYFDDLRNIAGWAHFTDYTFSDALKALNLSLDMNDVEYIIQFFTSKQEVLSFLKGYDSCITLKKYLLSYLFYNGEDLESLEGDREVYCWFRESAQENCIRWIQSKNADLILETLNKKCSPLLLDLLLGVKNIREFNDLEYILVSTFVLSLYPNSCKNALITQHNKFKKEMFFDETLAITLIKENPLHIEQLNHVLTTKKNTLSLFEDSQRLDYFLSKTMGYLNVEWEWVWDYIKHNISNESILNELPKIRQWYNGDLSYVDILLHSFELIEYINEEKTPTTFEEWVHYYTTIYLRWFPSFDRGENIEKQLQELNNGNGQVFQQIFEKIQRYRLKREEEYQNFLFSAFPSLLQQDKVNTKVIGKVHYNISQTKVMYLIIDGLPWEIWDTVRNTLEVHGYFLETGEQSCLSMIPSLTSVSRLSVVSGETLAILVNEKNNGLYTHSVSDEYKHIQRRFKKKQVVFQNGHLDSIDKFLSNDADLYTLIYSETDSLLHSAGQLNLSALQALLEQVLGPICEKVKQKDSMVIVVSTDHGMIKIENKMIAELSVPDSIGIVREGNAVYLWAENLDEECFNELKGYIDVASWFVIWEEDLESYGLPKVMPDGKFVYAWLFPKNNYYVTARHGNYTHGGLTMQETIIPFGVFRQQVPKFHDLSIEIESENLVLNENSQLSLSLFNPNDFSLKKIEISTSIIKSSTIIIDLPPKGRQTAKLSFVLEDRYVESERFRNNIILKISYLNEVYEQRYYLDRKIQVSGKAINRELSRKRSLDF